MGSLSRPSPAFQAASAPDPTCALVLSSDANSRVVLDEQARVVRKVLWCSGLRSVRTLGRRSRAEREFLSLRRLEMYRVPSVRAMSWRESRQGGRVVSCELVTECVPGAEDLRALLRRGMAAATRREVAVRYGQLLGDLHRAGFCSTTASPRNVLSTADGELKFCDQPYAARIRSGAFRFARDLDLFDAFFSSARREDWTHADRLRGVVAAAGGDRAVAATTWRRLSRRPRLWFRLLRQLCRLPILHRPTPLNT